MFRKRYSILTGLLLCMLMTLVFTLGRPASAAKVHSDTATTQDFVHQTSLNQPGQIEYLTEASAGQPLAIVTSLLQQRRQDLGLTWADTATTSYVVSDLYQSDHNGVTHVYLVVAVCADNDGRNNLHVDGGRFAGIRCRRGGDGSLSHALSSDRAVADRSNILTGRHRPANGP